MADTSKKKIAHVLEAIVLQISDNLTETVTSSLSNIIVTYLNNHYQERITLKDISQMTYFSAAYCESEFKRQMGTSIIQYLLDIRIEEAKRLLSESSMSWSRIANAVGFEDANCFSRIFKKKTGYSPIGYRRFSSL
jgi:two-component system response regulator YesN